MEAKNVRLTPMDDNDLMKCREIAALDSANDLMKVEKKSFEECVKLTEDYWRRRLPDGIKTKNHYLLNILDFNKNEKVGFIWGNVIDEVIHRTFCINHILVFDEYRNQGYGKSSLTELEKLAAEKECDGMWLSVWVNNDKARSLYEKLGYDGMYLWMRKSLK